MNADGERLMGKGEAMQSNMVNAELDYEHTSAHFHMLADIRFKLLALVPTLAAFAVALLSGQSGRTAVPVAIIGFVATLGVVIYELRNTQLYDATMQRMRVLESELGFQATRHKGRPGGPHLARPHRSLRFMLWPVGHDLGLALIYSGALATWTYVGVNGAFKIWVDGGGTTSTAVWVPIAISGLVFGTSVFEFIRIDNANDQLRRLPENLAAKLRGDDQVA